MSLRVSSLALVALLAEGVDRNVHRIAHAGLEVVALLAEGVDRNYICKNGEAQITRSPSSRRAQVEIDTKIW